MAIRGLSHTRQLPRLGKIRLGLPPDDVFKYPRDVDYFVCPPEVTAVYGEQPKALDIIIPVENEEMFFPHFYKRYSGNHILQCKGDGEKATTIKIEGKKKILVETKCPCPLLDDGKKSCSPKANLMVILPKVSMGGVYQIDTGSIFGIIKINSSIDYLRGLLGHVAMQPLKLVRVPQDINFEGKHTIKHVIDLRFDGDLNRVRQLRQRPNMFLGAASAPIAEDRQLPAADDEEEVIGEEPQEQAQEQATESVPVPAIVPQVVGARPMNEGQIKAMRHAAKKHPDKAKLIEQIIAAGGITEPQAAALIIALQKGGTLPEWVTLHSAATVESPAKAKLREMVAGLGKGYSINEDVFAELTDDKAAEWVDEFDPIGRPWINVAK